MRSRLRAAVEAGVRRIALTVVLLCAACSVPAGPPLQSTAPVPAPASDAAIAAVTRDVIAEVNRTREANGLRALRADAALNRAARDYAEELAVRRTLSHTSTNQTRRTMAMRLDAAGGAWSRGAENLGNVSGAASDVATRTVAMWLRSQGHRRNLLEAAYTHTGVGVAIDERGVWYITQLYVLPR
ncbi:MAG TPA: CAP domain-containing protein [Longimicrobiales bacterium]|nr:CAP domain-containing protein [Longimicrobiales bacterium]